MKKLMLFFLICGCNLKSAKESENVTDTISHNTDLTIVKNTNIDNTQYVDTLNTQHNKQEFLPDTSISKIIYLCDYFSVEDYFGDLMKYVDDTKDYPEVFIANNSSSEFLKMLFYPGDSKNSFSYFQVFAKKPVKYQKSDISIFTTESGIRLGMSKSSLIKAKGNGFVESNENKKSIITYTIVEPNSFLKRYNYYKYTAQYIFKDNKLIEFSFGFEYP